MFVGDIFFLFLRFIGGRGQLLSSNPGREYERDPKIYDMRDFAISFSSHYEISVLFSNLRVGDINFLFSVSSLVPDYHLFIGPALVCSFKFYDENT